MAIKWIQVSKRLPKIGQECVLYYRIDESEYFATGRIESIRTHQSEKEIIKIIDWLDSENNPIEPSHWCAIHPPITKG